MRGRLRGWRVAVARRARRQVRTVSAERGYLREAGNLVFHLAPARPARRVRASGSCSATRARSSCWPAAASSATPASSATTRSAPACAWTAPSWSRSACGRRLHGHLPAERAAGELHRRHRLPVRRRTSPRATATVAARRRSRSTTRCAPTAAGVYLLGPRLRAALHGHLSRTGSSAPARSSGGRSTRPRCCRRAPRSSPGPA